MKVYRYGRVWTLSSTEGYGMLISSESPAPFHHVADGIVPPAWWMSVTAKAVMYLLGSRDLELIYTGQSEVPISVFARSAEGSYA